MKGFLPKWTLTLGVADPGSHGPWEWRAVTRDTRVHEPTNHIMELPQTHTYWVVDFWVILVSLLHILELLLFLSTLCFIQFLQFLSSHNFLLHLVILELFTTFHVNLFKVLCCLQWNNSN